MKIIVPVHSLQDTDSLLSFGAQEVYGGVILENWRSKYGDYVETNRRSSFAERANFKDVEELLCAVRLCREHQVRFHLTMNALSIAEDRIALLMSALEQFQKAGASDVIISDITLIPPLRKLGLDIVISSCANVVNSETARFYRDLGVKRIIFPRTIRIEEIRSIAQNVPDIEYEAFLMNSGCRFTDGNCLCLHNTKVKALCDFCDYSPHRFFAVQGGRLSEEEVQTLEENHKTYKNTLYKACGQCELYHLLPYIHSLKIVGRGMNLQALQEDIALTQQNLAIAKNASSHEMYLQTMKKPSDSISRCRDHRNCYYK